MRLTVEARDFLADVLTVHQTLRREGRVDAVFLIQTGPRYGLKPGPPSFRSRPHPGLVDELAELGLVRTEPPGNVSRKFRLTAAGEELALRLARSAEADGET